MRSDDDVRSLFGTIGGAALGVGLGLGILIAGYVVSRVALPDNVIDASTIAAPIVAASGTIATPQPSAVAVVRPSTSASPTTRATATADPLVVTAFQGQSLRLAALTVPAGYTLTSPIAGTVSVVLYQFVNGEVRTGAEASGAPSYPYIFIRSADREVKLRPGALDRDVQLLVKDGDTIAAGAPVLKTLTTGASSWKTFYDANVTAQVVASATSGGAEIDPVALFKK